MTARTIATLKANMPVGTTGGTSVQDIHDVVDTLAGRTYVSVTDFGAIGDDDYTKAAANATAFQAAIDSLGTRGGTVFVPPGIFPLGSTIRVKNRVTIAGCGYGTMLARGNPGTLVAFEGTSAGTTDMLARNRYTAIRNIHLMGNGLTGALIKADWADNINIDAVRFDACPDTALVFNEVWDSRITNCWIEECGTAAAGKPAWWFRNGPTNPSPDNTNQIFVRGCRFEQFRNGAIHLGQTGDTNVTNGIYISDCKFETNYFAGPVMRHLSTCNGVTLTNIYVSLNSYDAGFTAGATTNMFETMYVDGFSATNMHLHVASGVAVRSCIRVPDGSPAVSFINVYHQGQGLPAVGIVDAPTFMHAKMNKGYCVSSNPAVTVPYSQSA